MLTIRAKRRYRYFTKLKNQQLRFVALKKAREGSEAGNGKARSSTANEMYKMKKARLVEEQIPYEEMALFDKFEFNEISMSLQRDLIRRKRTTNALQKARVIDQQLIELKQVATNSLLSYVDSMHDVQENFKKIMYNRFDANKVSCVGRETPQYLNQIEKIKQNAEMKNKPDADSDYPYSDSSGNNSDNDELNQIKKF